MVTIQQSKNLIFACRSRRKDRRESHFVGIYLD